VAGIEGYFEGPAMMHRRCLEKVLNGGIPDRIPAVFRLEIWHKARLAAGDLPAELRGLTLEQVEDRLGLARSARKARVFHTRLRAPVECRETRQGDSIITEWRTPAGTLRKIRRYGPGDEAAGISPSTIEYPIKTLGDYAAYEAIWTHTDFVPAYDEFVRYDQAIGEAGLPMVILGPNPFHDLLLAWTGYEQGYMDLFDCPDAFLHAVETADRVYRTMWDIVAASPARLVMHGVNFDASVTPPAIFQEHFLPYFTEFNRHMHDAGKKVAFHGDGELTDLLDLIRNAGFDVADCFACAPMTRCTLDRARRAWADRITIWGGVPSILLEPTVPPETLRAHLAMVHAKVAPGNNFILGLADQAMPTAAWTHIKLAAEFAPDVSSHDVVSSQGA
jgi:hypothetical protein